MVVGLQVETIVGLVVATVLWLWFIWKFALKSFFVQQEAAVAPAVHVDQVRNTGRKT